MKSTFFSLTIVLFGMIGLLSLEEANRIYPRGYLTTPIELQLIATKAELGQEPYASSVANILEWAEEDWDFRLDRRETCSSADRPSWLDEEGGIPIIYAKALAYHLTGENDYAHEVVEIIHEIISNVESFSLKPQCHLNLSWGVPELIISADLVVELLAQSNCEGPISWDVEDETIGDGNCLLLFQNWLAKNPYYIVSLIAENSQNNWGASATNTLAYIADFLSNRQDILLVHRMPIELNANGFIELTPVEAYFYANQLLRDSINGYRVDFRSSLSCDYLSGRSQHRDYEPVKSQITELGIIPEEARRDQFCNIPKYNDNYQNYPQLYLGSNIQQCELMLRRGDSSCYDNIALDEVVNFTYVDANGSIQNTHLRAGRGSIERAINAVIIDASAEWRHDSALEVAFRYYSMNSYFGEVSQWLSEIDQLNSCYQDICFGTLTHGFASDERPLPPPISAIS